MEIQWIDGQRIVCKDDQISQLASFNRALILFFECLPSGIYRDCTKCLIRSNPVFGSELSAVGCQAVDGNGYQMQGPRWSNRGIVMQREPDARSTAERSGLIRRARSSPRSDSQFFDPV
ncbi:hypothetical protein D3C81_1299800 [compost metagenome]